LISLNLGDEMISINTLVRSLSITLTFGIYINMASAVSGGVTHSNTSTNNNQTGPWLYQCRIFYFESGISEVDVEFTADRKTTKPIALKKATIYLPDNQIISKWNFWGNNPRSDTLNLTPKNLVKMNGQRVLGVTLDFKISPQRHLKRFITHIEGTAKIIDNSESYGGCTRR